MDPVCVWGVGEPPEASAGLTFEYLYDTFALRRQQLVSLLITISLERGFQLLQAGAALPRTPPLPPLPSLLAVSTQAHAPSTRNSRAGSQVRGRLWNQEKQIQARYAKTHSASAVLTEIRVSYCIPLHLLFHMRME